MRLSVAANFDEELLPRLREFPVTEIFGKLSTDAVGGGRASFMLAPVTRARFESYVAAVHREGIAFNYLLNPACMGNREFTRAGQRDLRKLLDWLSTLNVEVITVSLPFLLELIKTRYPHFRVKVGVYAKTTTPQQARHWENLGADCISLESLAVNREFARLRAIRDAVNCELQLIANSNCLQECPFSPYHMVGLSHASRKEGRIFIDYCLLRCSTMKLAAPVYYIRSEWIRPEDTHHYEEIGYQDFKILERDAPSEVLLTRVRAYAERHYDGNLLDLIQPYGYRAARSASQPRQPWLWEFRNFLRPRQASPRLLLKWRELAQLRGMLYQLSGEPSVYIDNRALDGFIKPFLTQGCAERDCETCGYCDQTAQEIVRVNTDYQRKCVELGEELLRYMKTGEMWGV